MFTPADSSRLSSWTTSRIIAATLVVLSVAVSFWALYQLRFVVLILFTAFIIGTALNPLSNRLQRWGLPPILSVVLIYAALSAILIGFALLITPLIFDQVSAIIDTIPSYYRHFRAMLVQSPNLLLQQFSWRLPPELSMTTMPVTAETSENMSSITHSMASVALLFKSLFITIATLMLSLYWTLEGKRVIRSLLLLISSHQRENTRELVNEMHCKVGAYVRGQAILCVVIGLMALVAYVVLGVPYALVLALFAGLMEAVPYLGPILGALPAILIAASADPAKAIWVIVATIIIQQIENAFLVPRIMSKSVGVNPFIALLAIFTFGSLLGVLGVLLAIPIAAILQLLLDHFLLEPSTLEQQFDGRRDGLSRLRYRIRDLIRDVQKQVRQAELIPSAENEQLVEEDIEAIAADLDSILVQGKAVEVRL